MNISTTLNAGKIVFTAFCIFLGLNFYAQNPTWEWAKIGGSVGKDAGSQVAIDSQGNVYVLGGFRDNNMTIGSTTLNNAGDDDIFFAKYNSVGALIWAKNIGNTGTDISGVLLIDKNDEIYVSGKFSSPTLTIGTTTLMNPNPGSFFNADFFIAKYNTSGQVLWVKNGSNSNFNAGLVAIDNDLNRYSIVAGVTSVDIEKYDALDNFIWSRAITTTGSISSISYRGFYADNSGAYITGGFFGTSLTIGSVTLINTTAQNSNDMYVAKLDTLGNVVWAKNATIAGGDHGVDVVVDNAGNSYVLGQFIGSAIFDSQTITSNGSGDLFLVKYNPSGQVVWAKNAGGSENDWVNDLAVDVNGSAYIIGETFSPAITFANTTLTNAGFMISSADVFILKYSSFGNEVWMKTIQGAESDNGNGIAINNTGEVYVTGAIEDVSNATTNIGNTSLTHFGLDDFFLAKLSSTVGIEENNKNNYVSVYPNPTSNIISISYSAKNLQEATVRIYDLTGRVVITKNYEAIQAGKQNFSINISNLQEGTYFYTLQVGEQTYNGKVVKMEQ